MLMSFIYVLDIFDLIKQNNYFIYYISKICIKMLKFTFIAYITFIFLNFTNQVFLILDPYETMCVGQKIKEESAFSGVYFVSGQHEDKNNVYIKTQYNKNIWSSKGQKNASFNVNIVELGNKYRF